MRGWQRTAGATLGALLGVAAPAPARGQQADSAAAEALFAEGREAMRRREHGLACSRFEASQRLDPGVGTELNLADCREALGDLVAAWEHLRRAVFELAAQRDDRLDFARGRLAAIERRLPRLAVRLAATAPADARVTRDDIDLPRENLGAALPINPGAHVIRVSAPGFEPRRVDVAVMEGERKEITVAPGPRPARPTGSSQRTWGFVGIGAGGAALLGGIASGAVALDRRANLDQVCAPDATGARGCPPSAEDEVSTFRLTRTLSYVGFGLGIVGVGFGVTLLLTAPHDSDESARDPLAGARVPRVTPFFGPGCAGVSGVF